MKALLAGLVLCLAVPSAGLCGQRLVVFGPSSWDTFAPGAPDSVVNAVTANLDAGFKRQHPEVTDIIHDARGTVAEGLSRLRNAQFAGEQIDVIICAANRVHTSFAARGLIQPVDDVIARLGDQFNAGAVGNFTRQGRVWGVPLSAANVTTFFYNRNLFQQVGSARRGPTANSSPRARSCESWGSSPWCTRGKTPGCGPSTI